MGCKQEVGSGCKLRLGLKAYVGNLAVGKALREASVGVITYYVSFYTV